ISPSKDGKSVKCSKFQSRSPKIRMKDWSWWLWQAGLLGVVVDAISTGFLEENRNRYGQWGRVSAGLPICSVLVGFSRDFDGDLRLEGERCRGRWYAADGFLLVAVLELLNGLLRELLLFL
ncbi:hypothetical protein AABB24_032670, partial [Solanum stoloniferum]